MPLSSISVVEPADGQWPSCVDRPDLTIDILDQNLAITVTANPLIAGEKYQSDFRDFYPSKKYDGIWAHHSLFFLAQCEVGEVFHRLADSLALGGTLAFTMAVNNGAARQVGFAGMNRPELDALLEKENLVAHSIIFDENAEYGGLYRRAIPTFYVRAQKLAAG